MKTLYLIRHGQASFGAKDYDNLSPLGFTQSESLGHALRKKEENYDLVIRGTLNRHQQTSTLANYEQFAEADLDWNEFDHKAIFKWHMVNANVSSAEFSKFSDSQTLAFFSEALVDWTKADTSKTLGIETWAEFKNRISQVFERTLEKTDRTALVFTSGGPISAIIGQTMGFDAQQTLKMNWQLVNTGITKIFVSTKRTSLASINEHAHLENPNNKTIITYK